MFLVTDNRTSNGPLGRSPHLFARSAHSLCKPPLIRLLAPFTGSLTHFAHSLVGQLKFLNMCSRCYRVSRVQTCYLSSLETRPEYKHGLRLSKSILDAQGQNAVRCARWALLCMIATLRVSEQNRGPKVKFSGIFFILPEKDVECLLVLGTANRHCLKRADFPN